MFGNRGTEWKAARELDAMKAAGAYLLAAMADDGPGVDEAIDRVRDPLILQGAVVEVAQRAVLALARARGAGVDEVMASLTGSPPMKTEG